MAFLDIIMVIPRLPLSVPHLDEPDAPLQQPASDEQLPVTFMTINVWEIRGEAGNAPDARLASALKTWKAKEFTLPIAMDYSDQTAAAYGVQGIPTTIIVRSDGIVHAVHVGVTDAEDLKKDVQAAIKAVEPGM